MISQDPHQPDRHDRCYRSSDQPQRGGENHRVSQGHPAQHSQPSSGIDEPEHEQRTENQPEATERVHDQQCGGSGERQHLAGRHHLGQESRKGDRE